MNAPPQPTQRTARLLGLIAADSCDATHQGSAPAGDVALTVCGFWQLCDDCREAHEAWCRACAEEADRYEDRRDIAADRLDGVA